MSWGIFTLLFVGIIIYCFIECLFQIPKDKELKNNKK